jgi:hypothetical protein
MQGGDLQSPHPSRKCPPTWNFASMLGKGLGVFDGIIAGSDRFLL